MGCRLIIVGLLTLVLLMGAAGAALFHYFGWYALLAIPVVAILFSVFVRVIVKRLILIPFKMKGKVLKDATATVHEVSFTGIKEENAGEDADGGEDAQEESSKPDTAREKKKLYTYLIDLTIHPSGKSETSFKLWDPSELMIVPPDSKPSFEADAADESLGTVMELAWFENGQWQADFDKLQGEQRIRLKVHLEKPNPSCKLRYYFYDVTTVTLPAVAEG